MNLTGSCLCGAVRYYADALQPPIDHCQCAICHKANMAVFVSTVGVTRDRFRWIAGKSDLSAYEGSPGKLRRFCSSCGSHLIDEYFDPPRVIIRSLTLDDDGADQIKHR